MIALGIALMTVVGAGQAVEEALRRINLDALPPLTGGFLAWVAASYAVVAAGFLWVGFVLATGTPRRFATPEAPDGDAGAEPAAAP